MLKSLLPKSVRRLLRKIYKVVLKKGEEPIQIRLLTNRDSDNLGDQLIEECDISLIHAVMKNLGYTKLDYKIHSSAAGIITNKYLKTRDETLLESARGKIKGMDLLIFGGAPLFNYAYQTFYEKTIITLQMAEEYGVPVLFSAIGVEKYSETNSKCQRLKAALNLSCVKQITTRDDLESLKKYVQKKDIRIAKVADPAVFADRVFGLHQGKKRKGTIGLVVVRRGIFKDNRIAFLEKEQIKFWTDIVAQLTDKGYDYEFLTTGHFSDEVFLDTLCREGNFPLKKCVFDMNVPEDLARAVSSYDGLIAYRLHASITAYAFDIPAIGLTWNQKVSMFYELIGYPERALEPEEWKPEKVVAALKIAMEQGVTKNQEYIMSVYNTLFASMKQSLRPDKSVKKYSYTELRAKMPQYKETSLASRLEKLKRKHRRTYETYHKLEVAKALLEEAND